MQQFTATLTDKKIFGGDVFFIRLGLPETVTFSFVPGQYVILTIPQAAGAPVKRLYSIASAPGQPYLELLIKPVPQGASATYFSSLAVGAPVEVQGPAGMFTLQKTPFTKVFLATGTGYAPMRSFILSTATHTEDYHLFWGIQKLQDVLLLDEIRTLKAQDPRFHPTICLSREETLDAIPEADRPFFSLGRMNTPLQALIASEPQNSLEFYICGRREVTESMREYLYNLQIGKDRVFFERY